MLAQTVPVVAEQTCEIPICCVPENSIPSGTVMHTQPPAWASAAPDGTGRVAIIGLFAAAAPLGFIRSEKRPERTAAEVEMSPTTTCVTRKRLPDVTGMVVTFDVAAASRDTARVSSASVVTAVTPAIAVAALTI